MDLLLIVSALRIVVIRLGMFIVGTAGVRTRPETNPHDLDLPGLPSQTGLPREWSEVRNPPEREDRIGRQIKGLGL